MEATWAKSVFAGQPQPFLVYHCPEVNSLRGRDGPKHRRVSYYGRYTCRGSLSCRSTDFESTVPRHRLGDRRENLLCWALPIDTNILIGDMC